MVDLGTNKKRLLDGPRRLAGKARRHAETLIPKSKEDKGILKTIISGARWTMLYKITAAAAGLIVSILSARLLGSQGYGILQYVLGVLNLVFILGELGLTKIITRETAQASSDSAWARSKGILLFSLAVGATGTFLAAIGGSLITTVGLSQGDLIMLFWIGAGAMVVRQLMMSLNGVLFGLQRIATAGVGDLTRDAVLASTLGVLFLMMVTDPTGSRYSPEIVMTIRLAASIMALALCIVLTQRILKSLPSDYLGTKASFHPREWLLAGLPLILVAGGSTVFSNADIVMIGAILDPGEVGPYHAASRAAGLVIFALAIVVNPLSPIVARLYREGKIPELKRTIRRTTALAIVFGFSCAAVLVAFAGFFLSLFGPEFVSADTALRILVFGQLFNVLAGPVGALLVMSGRQNYAAIACLTGSVANIALNAILIPRYGIIGASMATALSTVLWNALLFYFAQTKVWGDAPERRKDDELPPQGPVQDPPQDGK